VSDEEHDELLEQLDEQIVEAEASGDAKTLSVLKKVQAENARRRVTNRELRDKMAALEAEVARRQDDLNAALKKEREDRQAILDRITSINQGMIDALPERARGIVPDGLDQAAKLEWLTKAAPILTTPAPSPTDGAAGSVAQRGADATPVGEAEAALARALGVDAQTLARRAKKGE
jgi:hypothetical protein